MKKIILIIAVVICLSGGFACREERQDNFAYYGNIDPGLDSMTFDSVKEILGEPAICNLIDYPDCFNSKGSPIIPLHNRYLNHMEEMFMRAQWNDSDSCGETLTLFFQLNSGEQRFPHRAIVFWGIRCAPEQTDSVLNLFVEKEKKHK